MSRLNHPRIVRVLHLPRESDDGYWWYAMEFVPGGSLKDAVFEQRLNRQATMEVLSDVADALDHAWQTERLVHRDVKPANILLDREGRGKLTDFDLVKAPDSTQLTIAVGDFDFGAPEVLRESGQPSPASDAYSLARTALFAFSAGKVPGRSGNSIEDVIAAAGLNQSQAKILKQTLQENPTDRVATPRAFMEALRRDEGEVPGTSPQPQSTSEPVRCSPSSIRVFLSYATEDADQARKLTEDLKRQGVDVRLDRDELVGGQLWRPAIEKAIRDASHFIALLSSRSVDRRGFVQKELRVALDVLEEHSDLSSYLIPVRLDECELSHSALAELHWVDLFPDFERGVRRIVASLGLSPLDPTAENGAEAETRSDNPAGYELVWIPSGTFEMGSREAEEGRWDDEGPVHTVTVQRGFYLGKYPVTNEQYAKFLQTKQGMREPDHGRGGRFGQSQQPVVGVSWDEAKAFCEWAGLILPGEAQWEYACRAGTRTRFWSGDKDSDLERVAWYADNSEGQPHSGGENPPNDFGLCDMHGNVWEWCQDTWHDTYVDAPTDGSAWCEKTTGTDYRVLRGGSWHNLAQLCRSASRDWRPAGARYAGVGFRPARSSD
jgi:formylglycine-generating enzyme required for sulfatase activity